MGKHKDITAEDLTVYIPECRNGQDIKLHNGQLRAKRQTLLRAAYVQLSRALNIRPDDLAWVGGALVYKPLRNCRIQGVSLVLDEASVKEECKGGRKNLKMAVA